MVWTGLGWDEAFQKEDIIFVDRLGGERVVPDDRKETRIPKAGVPVRNAKDEVVGRGNLAIWQVTSSPMLFVRSN